MTTPVQATTNFVTKKLETGFLNPVSYGDIKSATDAIKSLKQGEGGRPGQADAVIDNLSKSKKLDSFAREIVDNSGSMLGNGALTVGERKTFFKDMAKNLDAQSLAALHSSLVKVGGKDSIAGLNAGQELAAAVAEHSTVAQKIGFIDNLKSKTLDQKSVSGGGFGVSTSIQADPQAVAIGTVLGSMKGANAQVAFSRLSTDQLNAVVNSGVQNTITSTTTGETGSYSHITWNTKGYSNLMSAAATMPVNAGNADLRARIFDAGADTLRTMRDTEGGPYRIGAGTLGKDSAMSNATDGLTRLIKSDTNGTIGELSRNSTTKDGSDLATYSQQMLAQGKERGLGQIMGQLQSGNNRNIDPLVHLKVDRKADDGDTKLINAAALGYFVGAVSVGAKAQSDNIQQQRDSAALILKFAAIVGDKASGAVVGGAITIAGEFINPAMKAMISDPTADAGRVLSLGALPENKKSGESAVGDPVANAFSRARGNVLLDARP